MVGRLDGLLRKDAIKLSRAVPSSKKLNTKEAGSISAVDSCQAVNGKFAESMKYSWSWEYLLLLRAWRVHEHGIVMLWRSWRVHGVSKHSMLSRSWGLHDLNDHGEHRMLDDEIMKVSHTQDQMILRTLNVVESMKSSWFQRTFHALEIMKALWSWWSWEHAMKLPY